VARADLHMHTHFSRDSVLSPQDLVRLAEAKGLTHVAVTDHRGVDGAYAVREAASFEVIIGQEIRTSAGEILALFIEEPIPPKLSPGLTAARIRSQGGVVVVPHPFDPLRPSLGHSGLAELGSGIDAIEGYNGRTMLPGRTAQARRYAQNQDLPVSLGSDAHSGPEVGRSWIELPDFSGPQELLTVLRAANYHPAARAPWWLPLSGVALLRWAVGWRPKPTALPCGEETGS
jgi:predicted metal-dependent phosphoesterase TrpH